MMTTTTTTSFVHSLLLSITPLQTALLVDLSTAIIAHLWFRKYEPYNVSNCLLKLAGFAIPPVATAVITLQSSSLHHGLLHLALFVSFLLSSILLYRISPFHPLAKYPGPVICKISNIWAAWLGYKGTAHLYYDEVHKKYGPIVRVGPNEISLTDVDLIPEILGQQGMPKGPLWGGRNIIIPSGSKDTPKGLISVRDLNIHAQLRKPWNRSFRANAIQDYEKSLVETGTELVEHLQKLCRTSMDKFGHADLAQYIAQWSFDFMGDMAFGESFHLMRTGDKDGLVDQMKTASEIPTITQAIPWCAGFFRSIPFYSRRVNNFRNFAIKQAQKRITKVTDQRDLFYYLGAGLDIEDALPLPFVLLNIGLAIVAGSDTTSAVLSGIMYHLIRNPDYFQRLQKELDTAFPPSEHVPIRPDNLLNLELLNAVVNEGLRLQPAVPTGLQRAPALKSGGKLVGNMFIQEGTAVRVPPYVIHRSPRYFYPKPDEFWPERWFTKSDDLILNRSAFIPFSFGPANCAGKTLAMSELRYITAMLVYNFEISFEDGYDPTEWDRDLLDKFIVVVGKLPMKLRERVV